MKILNIDEIQIKEAAIRAFPTKYIEIEQADLFLKHIETGIIAIEGIDQHFYVNTNYVYEDRIVNGNKTRFKIHIQTIFVKEMPYEVLYDSAGKYFVAYEEDSQTKFCPYEEFQTFLATIVHLDSVS